MNKLQQLNKRGDRRGMHRRKFDPKMGAKLVAAHENGLTAKMCAKIANVTDRTIYNWIKRGEQEEGTDLAEFSRNWKLAEFRFEMYHLKKINESNDWRASKWLLEARNPEDWKVADKYEVVQEINNNYTVGSQEYIDTSIAQIRALQKDAGVNIIDIDLDEEDGEDIDLNEEDDEEFL